MKKDDFLWGIVIAVLLAVIAIPVSREIFIRFTSLHPYVGGFVKFTILATMGELLALRIISGSWSKPAGLFFRMLVWGFLGIVIALIFTIFASGVKEAMSKGLLLGQGYPLAFAFLTSFFTNLIFAPTMMIFHRLTDTYIDLRYKNADKSVKLAEVINHVDWCGFFSFVICRTIPFFWIPAHTITFLLSPEYRVLMAAVLSLALGLILAFAKKKSVSGKAQRREKC